MRYPLLAVGASLTALAVISCADEPTSPNGAMAPSKPSFSAIAQTNNSQFDVAIAAFVPCAAGGAGEIVVVTGRIHELIHFTVSNSGRVSLKVHDQLQGVSGVGLTTGAKYQASGVTQEMTHLSLLTGFPFNDSFVNSFGLIGQGPGNNLLIHETSHVTVNADGSVTSVHDSFGVDCK